MSALAGLVVAIVLGWFSWLSPVEGTLLAVFLFAGAHNWVELRYFLARWPSRWGKLAPFLATGLAGAILLTLWRILSGWSAFRGWFSEHAGFTSGSAWNAALLIWLGLMGHLSGRRLPAFNPWLTLGLLAAYLSLHLPPWIPGVMLVFAHPLVSLLFLHRSLRGEPSRRRFFAGLTTGMVLTCTLLWFYADPWPLATTDPEWSRRLAWQVGWPLLGINPGFLISTHLFLELVHYGIWILLIPAWGFKIRPHDIRAIPLAHLSPIGGWVLKALLVASTLFVLGLWGGFSWKPHQTWEIYFTLAIGHVLLEFVFVLRPFSATRTR